MDRSPAVLAPLGDPKAHGWTGTEPPWRPPPPIPSRLVADVSLSQLSSPGCDPISPSLPLSRHWDAIAGPASTVFPTSPLLASGGGRDPLLCEDRGGRDIPASPRSPLLDGEVDLAKISPGNVAPQYLSVPVRELPEEAVRVRGQRALGDPDSTAAVEAEPLSRRRVCSPPSCSLSSLSSLSPHSSLSTVPLSYLGADDASSRLAGFLPSVDYGARGWTETVGRWRLSPIAPLKPVAGLSPPSRSDRLSPPLASSRCGGSSAAVASTVLPTDLSLASGGERGVVAAASSTGPVSVDRSGPPVAPEAAVGAASLSPASAHLGWGQLSPSRPPPGFPGLLGCGDRFYCWRLYCSCVR